MQETGYEFGKGVRLTIKPSDSKFEYVLEKLPGYKPIIHRYRVHTVGFMRVKAGSLSLAKYGRKRGEKMADYQKVLSAVKEFMGYVDGE